MTDCRLGSINATLLVIDIEKSRFFYESLLNLKVQHEFHDGRFICYSWGNSDEVILRISQVEDEELASLPKPLGTGVEFILNVGRGYQYAPGPFEKHGYPFIWDGCLVAYDPDGYKWMLAG
ncbi:hypothetical protein [Streptococcus sp. 27098_8_113]|uniref:hypothetical protein n=1 Tax=Streptococcus sp. 27098_8_113 TaxID=3003669 RepID=UPI0025939814|nr:hypothetical protein [uncultured Streptococcus sp.]